MTDNKREIDPAIKSKLTAFLANLKANNKTTAKKVKYQEINADNDPQMVKKEVKISANLADSIETYSYVKLISHKNKLITDNLDCQTNLVYSVNYPDTVLNIDSEFGNTVPQQIDVIVETYPDTTLNIDWFTALEDMRNCLIYQFGLKNESDRVQWFKDFTGYEGKLKNAPTQVFEKVYKHLQDKITHTKIYLRTKPLIEARIKAIESRLNNSDNAQNNSDNSDKFNKFDNSDKFNNSDKETKSDNKQNKLTDNTLKSEEIKGDKKNIKADSNINTHKPILDSNLTVTILPNDLNINKGNDEYITIDDNYQLIDNDEDLKTQIALLKGELLLAIDTETTGLDPHIHKVRLIQIASNNHPTIIIDCYKCNPKLIQPLLINDSVKIFHNAKFDLKFFLAIGLEINQKLFDTMLAYQLINAGKSNLKASLKEVAKELLNIELNKDEQVSQWANKELTESQLKYSAIDAKILLPLREKLKEAIVTVDLIHVAKIEFDCVLAVAMMEFNGMLLDLGKWQNILEDTQKRKDELEIELKLLFKEKLTNYVKNNSEQLTLIANDFNFTTEINLDSPKQVLEALNKIGIPCQNTNSKTLKKLLINYQDILKPFLEYKKLTKILSSFGDTLINKINPVTGKLHGAYNQLRAETGRFTASNPNLQNLPRNKETRSCYIASPNHKLIIADYSQIELRIAAEITNDKTMISAYNKGEDLHKLTASIVLNKPLDEVTKSDRQIAKSANFGLIYGSSVNGFRGYAQSNYGISLSEKEAKIIMDKFFKSYSGFAKWHKQIKYKIYNQGINETRTLGNRRRLFDNPSPQQVLNTPIQGTGADILKSALANLIPALKPFSDKVKLLATVHDEIILEAHKEIAIEVAKVLSETMVNSGKEFLKRVPIEADSSICDNWSEK